MKWTRAYKDRLPDSAFLAISPGGHKDASGRTVPRTLRHLPVRDIRGNVSVTHVRNALARIAQMKTRLTEAQRRTAHAKAERLLAKFDSLPAHRVSKRKTKSVTTKRAPSLKTAKLRAAQSPPKKRRRK